MATRKSPLRDRLLSNSPDAIKSSILRESGMGWNSSSSASLPPSGSAGSITSPLRISKRDSPRPKGPGPIIARRTSSSYRHVHSNNLVTKSPFKSQIPTPSTPSRPTDMVFPTRRVSGEKRQRTSSMHEQAENENERPFALKRERKQSKIFQGLIEKEPVTKSPFKLQQRTPSSETKPLPPPSSTYIDSSQRALTPPRNLQPLHTSSGGPSPSPARSALVSKRLHGPRFSGGPRRQKKTVIFHKRCEVFEYDREEETDEEDVFQNHSEEDERDDSYQSMHEEDEPSQGSSPFNHDRDELMVDDPSCESIQLSDQGIDPSVPSLLSDPDASITGIVDEMFFSSNAANLLSDSSLLSTPPRHLDTRTDFETEDGVPLGRSHHVERFLQHHEGERLQQSPHILQPHLSSQASPLRNSPHQQSPSNYPFNFNLPTSASPHGPPATPPRRSPGTRHSTPPLGRSTHLERVRKAREEEREVEEDGDDIDKLPASPSPMKKTAGAIGLPDEALIPKFDLNTSLTRNFSGSSYSNMQVGVGNHSESNDSGNISIDPFGPRLQDVSILPDIQNHGLPIVNNESMDAANLSVGDSEANLSNLEAEVHYGDEVKALHFVCGII